MQLISNVYNLFTLQQIKQFTNADFHFHCRSLHIQCRGAAMGNLLRLLSRDDTEAGKVDIFLDFESKGFISTVYNVIGAM